MEKKANRRKESHLLRIAVGNVHDALLLKQADKAT